MLFADAVTYVHRYILSFGGGFRLYLQLIISPTYQQAALGARLLYGSAHELVDELFQSNLARDSLRHLDHGREVEVFDGRRNRTRYTGGWLILSEPWIQLIDLPHLAGRAPARIAVTSFSQIRIENGLEATCFMEASGQLVSNRLVVDKAVFARRANGLFV
jgi:hypothetical protein